MSKRNALTVHIRAAQSRIFDGGRAPLWPVWAYPGCAEIDRRR